MTHRSRDQGQAITTGGGGGISKQCGYRNVLLINRRSVRSSVFCPNTSTGDDDDDDDSWTIHTEVIGVPINIIVSVTK